MSSGGFRSLALCGLGLVAGVALAQGDALQVRSWAAACANCHGTQGVAQPGMVALAGQPRQSLLDSLRDFQAGRRPATIMHQLARGYTDEQLEQLAAYFAAQQP